MKMHVFSVRVDFKDCDGEETIYGQEQVEVRIDDDIVKQCEQDRLAFKVYRQAQLQTDNSDLADPHIDFIRSFAITGHRTEEDQNGEIIIDNDPHVV